MRALPPALVLPPQSSPMSTVLEIVVEGWVGEVLMKITLMNSYHQLFQLSRSVLGLAAAFTLASCATGYHKTGITGGYSETQLAPDIFRVSFSGNGFSSKQRAQDLVLLRAAELTLNHGYSYFIVGGESDISVNQTGYMPGHSYTSGSLSMVGNSAIYSAQTTYFPGMNIDIYKPGQELLIQCFRRRPDFGMVFDASFLYSSLTQKYGVKTKQETAVTGVTKVSRQTNQKDPVSSKAQNSGGTLYLVE